VDFKGHLLKKKSGIVKKWIHLVANTYAPETSKLLLTKKDRFANPVGATISSQLEFLFDALANMAPSEEISVCLDKIIRVRAVQDFSPSQAVRFVIQLKQIIKEELKKELSEEAHMKELTEFELRIDGTVLIAFDIYMSCREKLHQIKYNELRKSGFLVQDETQG
jgi:hypothetical protein